MSTERIIARERAELCDLMLEVGPAAPTLNEGWAVLDLAAHLVVREHDLWAAGGIVLGGPFRAALDLAMRRRRRQGLDALVAIVRAGEPVWWRLAPKGTQLPEYYIHHEDVRRANGLGPRTDRPDLDEKLRRLAGRMAPLALRKVDTGVEIVCGGETVHRHGEPPWAVIDGAPGEVVMYLSGRRSAAEVDLSGSPAGLAVLAAAELGM